IHRQGGEEQAAELATDLQNLGIACYRLGNYAESEQALRESLAIRARTYGPDSRPAKNCLIELNNLGLALVRAFKFRSAEPLLREVLEIRRKVLGPNHLDYAISLVNYADLLRVLADYKQSERMSLEALEVLRRAEGEQSTYYASALSNLALL